MIIFRNKIVAFKINQKFLLEALKRYTEKTLSLLLFLLTISQQQLLHIHSIINFCNDSQYFIFDDFRFYSINVFFLGKI